jgi:outer membrane protein assembly factor BamE (lipoprotein component of BamABCDE complex)
MRRFSLSCVTLLALVAASGCATITRGTTEVLVINTTPAGASVQLSSGNSCTTPCSVELKRKRDYHVKITKDGYEPIDTDVLSQISGAGAAGMAGNVLIGGLIGVGVDAATGATKSLKPNPVVVTLTPTARGPILTPTIAAAAATMSDLASVTVEDMCVQPSRVDRNECAGKIRIGMPQTEVLAVLGVPTSKSADSRTLRYEDRYMLFDQDGNLTKITETL